MQRLSYHSTFICLLMIVFMTGCRTHLVLRDRTLETTATLTDMQYRLVLDNVARFVRNPASIPSIAVVNGGSVLVSDQGSFGGSGTYAPTIIRADQIGGFPILSLFANPNATRNLTENWSVVPVTDVDKVRRLRCAYQLLMNAVDCNCEDCFETLEGYVSRDPVELECDIPHGWFCVGSRKDVPKNACYVGHHSDTYVWVSPQSLDGLSRFTLTVMTLSTSELGPLTTKTVIDRFDANGKLLETEVVKEMVDEDAPKPTDMDESGSHMRDPSQPYRHSMLSPRTRTPKQSVYTPKQLRKRGGPP